MTEKLLKEYIDRFGIVTSAELSQRTGVERTTWFATAVSLVLAKDVFLCRLAHGRESLISRHLFNCLRTVYTEPSLSDAAQALYDWLCDNGPAERQALADAGVVDRGEFADAMAELQKKLCIAPGALVRQEDAEAGELERRYAFSWETVDAWADRLYRPVRYNDLAYCVSEVMRLLKNHFTTRELNELVYHGRL